MTVPDVGPAVPRPVALALLGLSEQATATDVVAAYRRLAHRRLPRAGPDARGTVLDDTTRDGTAPDGTAPGRTAGTWSDPGQGAGHPLPVHRRTRAGHPFPDHRRTGADQPAAAHPEEPG